MTRGRRVARPFMPQHVNSPAAGGGDPPGLAGPAFCGGRA